MTQLLCPVCEKPLDRIEKQWICHNGHSFDIARQGYVNLLTVENKHSRNPGDTPEQVVARKEFLDAGYYIPIAQRVCEILDMHQPKILLDAGCGEGYYLTQIQKILTDTEFWGLDISKNAVRYGAVRNKKAQWITGTATHLPFADNSLDCVISMFALTAEQEFHRVLKKDGIFLQVIAGEQHLMGLKKIIYPEILLKEKNLHPILEGFSLEQSSVLEFSFSLTENRQIQNLLAMTPHFWRISVEAAKVIQQAIHLDDMAQVVFNCYRANST